MATCDPLDFVKPVQSGGKRKSACSVARKCKEAVSRAASFHSEQQGNSGKKKQTASIRDTDVPGAICYCLL